MKTRILLVLILLLGSFLRLYHLDKNPVSFYSDEVDAGYQAFIFNHNLHDYHGNFLPTSFQSFADYRTPFYLYSIAIVQKITGPTLLSIRLPAAIYGILSIIAIYFLAQEVFKSSQAGLIAAFLLAINPWHIHYSRIGFEATGMLFYLLLSFFFLQKNKIIRAALFSIFSIYFYSTAKLYVIFIALVYLFFNYRQVFKINRRHLIYFFIISLLVATPYLKDLVTNKAGFRFNYISIFTDPTHSTQVNYDRLIDNQTDYGLKVGLQTSLASKLFHNRVVSVVDQFSANYIQAFSTDFLFLKGGANLRQGFGQFGYFYVLDFFFIIFGLSLFIKTKKYYWLILFFLSPIASALTRDSVGPHGTRLILMLPFLIFFATAAINQIPVKFYFFIIGGYLISLILFWHFYFYHYPELSSRYWDDGLSSMITISQQYPNSKVVFSNRYEPVLPFYLFYSKYIPRQYNLDLDIKPANNENFSGNCLPTNRCFGFMDWNNYKPETNTYYLIPDSEYIDLPPKTKNQLSVVNKIVSNHSDTPIIYFLK